MNRKFHNSLMALVASSGLLAVTLMAASPVPASLAGADGTMVAGLEASLEADRDPVNIGSGERPMPRALRRGRQSVAMPFFSFAPRG
jgi:hypothetical protein